MRSFIQIFSLLGCMIPGGSLTGANIQVLDVETVYQRYPEEKRGLNLTVTWDHSWRNDKNHDAAWVFLKSIRSNGGYDHVPLRVGSARVLWKGSPDMPDATLEVSADNKGIFVYASQSYRGPLTYRIYVEQETDSLDENTNITRGSVLGYGLEMVYIPEGGFTLGDPKETALDYYAFYQSGPDGSYNGLYTIEEENAEITVGPEPGNCTTAQTHRNTGATNRVPFPPNSRKVSGPSTL